MVEIPIISSIIRVLKKEKPIKQVKVTRDPRLVGQDEDAASNALQVEIGKGKGRQSLTKIANINETIRKSNLLKHELNTSAKDSGVSTNNLDAEPIVGPDGKITGYRVKN